GEEEGVGWECLPAGESPQAGPASLPPLAAAEAVNPPGQLRGAEKPPLLPSGLLRLHRPRSRNTIAAVAGKLAAWVALAFVLAFLPYPNQCGPGKPFSDSLLIAKEIL